MTFVIHQADVEKLGFDLQAAVDDFAAALEAHKRTINRPAPVAHPVVETIVRQHDGSFSITMPPAPPVLTFAEKKAAKLAELADVRWQHETGGMVFNGYEVSTDVISQTKIIGAVVGVQIDPTATIKWKMADGEFVTLDAAALVALGSAIRAHVQACFDNEAALASLISVAADEADLDEIDLTAGWPA